MKNAGAVIKERTLAVPTKLAEGAIEAGKVADKTITNMKNVLSNLMPAPEFAFAGGAVKQSIENTHVTVNAVKYMVSKIEGLNIGGKKIKGKFGFDSTSELKGFDKQISKELEKHNLSLEEFHDLRLKPVSALSSAQLSVMKGIRDAVPPITKDTLLQKTIPIKDVENYLSGEYREIGGYVAKAEDVADIRKYDDVVESSRLDYTTSDGTRPYPEGEDSYAMIRFKTSEIDKIDIPYGEKLGGINKDGPPCTQNGFTGARNGKVIPEWNFSSRSELSVGAELYQVIGGQEKLIGIFNGEKFIKIK